MFLNICYYLFTTGTCFLTGYGFYYWYDQSGATQLAYHMSWKGLEWYTKCETYYNKHIYTRLYPIDNSKKDEDSGGVEGDEENQYIVHNKDNDKYEVYIDIPDDIKYDWLVVKQEDNDETNYKVIDDINQYNEDEESVKLNYKPFLQVEIENSKGEKTEIQDNLNFFFLENNKIFDRHFTVWYMKNFYNMDITENYKLHIIDSSINVFTLGSEGYIVLEKNNYIIKGS